MSLSSDLKTVLFEDPTYELSDRDGSSSKRRLQRDYGKYDVGGSRCCDNDIGRNPNWPFTKFDSTTYELNRSKLSQTCFV